MTRKEMSIEQVSPDKERMLRYKLLAVAFSYPDDNFFTFFPKFISEKENILPEYDRLFRANEIWLYSAEHTAENEFQRSVVLSDINGFYRAFGLETGNRDRPDSIATELEFMYYLILKEIKAPDRANASICLDAQKKFFTEHLYPTIKVIAKNIISNVQNGFYREVALSTLEFIESEERRFKRK